MALTPIVFALILPQAACTVMGALKLDNSTFDKIISLPGYATFVKFDKTYSWGRVEDQFKIISRLATHVPNLFVAEIPCQDPSVASPGSATSEGTDNHDLRDRFKLKNRMFPVFMFFDEKHPKGLIYTGSHAAANIGEWIRSFGIDLPKQDRIEEIDGIVEKFLTKDKRNPALIEEAKKVAKEKHKFDHMAPMYIEYMQKFLDEGDNAHKWVQEEIDRLNGHLDKTGYIAPAHNKQAEFEDRLQVIELFKPDYNWEGDDLDKD